MKKWRVLKGDQDHWVGPWLYLHTMYVARRQIKTPHGPFRIVRNHKPVAKDLSRTACIDKLKHVVKEMDAGDSVSVFKGDGSRAVWIRAIQVNTLANVSGTWAQGNDRIDAIVGTVLAQWPHVENWGIYVCKYIAGTSSLSQHSYANAVDFGGESMAVLQDIANALVAKADALKLEHVIVGSREWTRGEDWHYYSGEYHYHVHCDPNPQFSGSCGYRN